MYIKYHLYKIDEVLQLNLTENPTKLVYITSIHRPSMASAENYFFSKMEVGKHYIITVSKEGQKIEPLKQL